MADFIKKAQLGGLQRCLRCGFMRDRHKYRQKYVSKKTGWWKSPICNNCLAVAKHKYKRKLA